MTIVNFTPVSALLGGALIGLAATMMWWVLGRISGVSGIIDAALTARGPELSWRTAFIGGLLGSGAIAILIFPSAIPFNMAVGFAGAAVAGLLVGVGTSLAGGCTSGHGVCGVSRLSVRSLIATAIFMATGFLTVFLVRHLL